MPASADQVRNQEWWLGSLHINAAGAASQGSGVTVAVLSDGVNASAPDLSASVTAAPAPVGAPVASGQYAGEQGTPVASLIAGHGHGPTGAAGIVGVAPQARILSIQVTLPPDDPQLAQSSVAAAIPGAIAAGIRYAVNHGATVIDLPIDPGEAGSSGTGGATAAAGGSAAERSAVSFALAHNVVLVAPAGDDATAGDAPNYPAAYRGVMAVGAVGSAFTRAPWSSHQRYVTLTAAGVGVVAAASTGGYATMNSTSAASAVVSGIVALIRSRYPSLTVAEIRRALITTTTSRRAGRVANGSGYGAVNAGQAMIAAAALAAPPGHRAGAGAVARQAPATVTTPASEQSIASQILRAGEISGGLLIALLLLIAGYAAMSRRQRRSHAAVTAEWVHRQGQSRYPQAGVTDADKMLELFAVPAAAPSTALATVPSRPQPASPSASGGVWLGGGGGVFAAASGRAPDGLRVRQLGGPAASEAGMGAVADGGSVAHGPASRAVNRRVAVSGAPPWEPAAAPEGELPWAAAPTRPDDAAPAAGSARPAPASAEPASDTSALVRPVGPAPDGRSQPGSAPGLEYDPIGRAAHLGRQATARGLSSAGGASSAGGLGSPPDSAVPSAPPPTSAGYPSPTGAPVGFDFGADYARADGRGPAAGRSAQAGYEAGGHRGQAADPGYPDRSATAPGHSGEFAVPTPPRIAPSGLPVRQPRASRPPGSAPLSPSGSLWEPVNREAGQPSEPTDYPAQSYDRAGRPIFVWDPATTRGSQTNSGE